MRDALSGWKSYLCSIGIIFVTGLHAMNYINDGTFTTLMGLLTGSGIAAIRASIAKGG